MQLEAISVASAFATIVGLIGAYKGERRSEQTADLEQFVRWLSDHGFRELISELRKNTQISASIEALLSEESDVLQSRLERLDRMLVSLAAHIDGLGPLASAVRPGTDCPNRRFLY